MEWLIPYKIDDEPAAGLPDRNGAPHSFKEPGCLLLGPHVGPLSIAWFKLVANTKRALRGRVSPRLRAVVRGS